MRYPLWRLGVGPLLVTLLLLASIAGGQAPESWRSGAAFDKALKSPVSFTFRNPVRQSLLSLSQSQHVAVFLDRRIDPDQLLGVNIAREPLERGFQEIASALGASVCYVDSIAYFGPGDAADRLAAVAEINRNALRGLPARSARAWSRRAALRWDELSTPVEVLNHLAAEGDLTLSNVTLVPHDLWPAVESPPLRLIDRFTLVLAGFDLTLEIHAGGSEARIVAFPATITLAKKYTHDFSDAQLAELRGRFSTASIQRRSPGIQVEGGYQIHAAIERLLRDESQATVRPAGEVRFHLEVKHQPLGAVVKKIVEQADLDVTVAANAKPALYAMVSFRVEDATLAQLLEAAFAETDLDYELAGKKLIIKLR